MKVLCDYCGEWFDKKPSTVKAIKTIAARNIDT